MDRLFSILIPSPAGNGDLAFCIVPDPTRCKSTRKSISTPEPNWPASGRRPPLSRAEPGTTRKVLSARSAPSASTARITRSAKSVSVRPPDARCGLSGQVDTPGSWKLKKHAAPTGFLSSKPPPRTRGRALPNSATPVGCQHDGPAPRVRGNPSPPHQPAGCTLRSGHRRDEPGPIASPSASP
jgi:hypothetical protein